MGFQHPSQHDHMMRGIAAAAKSSKTPKHLKAHLQSRLEGGMKTGTTNIKTPAALKTPAPNGIFSGAFVPPKRKAKKHAKARDGMGPKAAAGTNAAFYGDPC